MKLSTQTVLESTGLVLSSAFIGAATAPDPLLGGLLGASAGALTSLFVPLAHMGYGLRQESKCLEAGTHYSERHLF